MSKTKGKKPHPDPAPLGYERHDPPKPHVIALKSRPKLLLLFSLLLALWITLLLFLYFSTIYPTRHGETKRNASALVKVSGGTSVLVDL